MLLYYNTKLQKPLSQSLMGKSVWWPGISVKLDDVYLYVFES